MGWLLAIFRPLGQWMLSFGLKWALEKVSGSIVDYKAKKEREKQEAARKAAAEQAKKEMKEAGDNEEAQKQAIDKYLDSIG